MQLIDMHSTRSHVVAYGHWCLTFDGTEDFSNIANEISKRFGFWPDSLGALANEWTVKRMDVLIGALNPKTRTLMTSGADVALDPHSSPTMRAAADLLNIHAVRRALVVDTMLADFWMTQASDMVGSIPTILYHGTSSVHQVAIVKGGLQTDQPANWDVGGRNQFFLTATPQTAAFHARRTAARRGGDPVVIACRRPQMLIPDWDVQNRLVSNPDVPSQDGDYLAMEAGLFASPNPVRATDLISISTPQINTPAAGWSIVWCNPGYTSG